MALLERTKDEVAFSYVIAEPHEIEGVQFTQTASITFAYTAGSALELLDMFVDLL